MTPEQPEPARYNEAAENEAAAQDTTAGQDTASSQLEELSGLAVAFLGAWAGILRDLLGLLKVDAQLGVRAVRLLVVLTLAGGLLVVAVWLFASGALALLLMQLDLLGPAAAVFSVALLNLALLIAVVALMRRTAADLWFRNSRDALAGLRAGVGKEDGAPCSAEHG